MSVEGGRLVLVVGVGRSGTSLLTGILGQIGLRIPQPEVMADETNPRGFGEPRWAVDFHMRLLRARRVTVNDSRPAAWELMGAAAEDAALRAELGAWIREQLQGADVAVVKDPRTVWLLPLWMRCAAELGVQASFVTMLRHPAEIVSSARRSYGTWQTDASRTAAWMNVLLETEHATRGTPRAFVRYEDLLSDWGREIERVGDALELPAVAEAGRVRLPAADRFVDPSLHRSRVRWDELEVPERLRAMAEDVWAQAQELAAAGGDTEQARATLDASRAAYRSFYAEAEAIAQSSVTAAKRRGGRRRKPAPTLRMRVTRRVPVRYRRRLRSVVRALRPS